MTTDHQADGVAQAATEQAVTEQPPTEERKGRRLLLKGSVAAATVAVAGLAAARRADAANGDTLIIGDSSNTATSTTRLSGGSTLWVQNGGSAGDASVYGTNSAATRYGVRGDNNGGGAGVYGDASGSSAGIGVYGHNTTTKGIGVFGFHDSSTLEGIGVVGQSSLGMGVIAMGTIYDVFANGNGRIAFGRVGQGGTPGATGDGAILARDADLSLWWSYGANKWRKLAGVGTAGAFHAIDPVRAYDSRVAAYAVKGLMAAGSNRVVSVADGHDEAGAVTVANAVPAGATAIAYNVTVTGTTGPNFLSVVPGDASGYTTSTINWSGPDQSLANGSIVKLDGSRQVKLFCGSGTGSTHVIIDVTGYFL